MYLSLKYQSYLTPSDFKKNIDIIISLTVCSMCMENDIF